MLRQNVVQGCDEMWSKYVAQHNWTTFCLKKWCFFFLFFLLVFLKNLILPAERRRFLKNKKGKNKKKLDHILSQKKANLGPHFVSTAYIYIYIYINLHAYIHTYIHTYVYIYILWSYYLGQVWPVWGLLSGPSLFEKKLCVCNNPITLGFQHFKKVAHKNVRVIIWAKLAFCLLHQAWPRW